MNTFTFIDQLNLSKEENFDLYEELRDAFEESRPNYSVEASDTCVLTVFPPQWDNEMSDDDVVNYATGMFGQWPALLCMDDSHELLVLRDGRLETQHLFTVSSVKQEVQAEHEQSQLVQLS